MLGPGTAADMQMLAQRERTRKRSHARVQSPRQHSCTHLRYEIDTYEPPRSRSCGTWPQEMMACMLWLALVLFAPTSSSSFLSPCFGEANPAANISMPHDRESTLRHTSSCGATSRERRWRTRAMDVKLVGRRRHGRARVRRRLHFRLWHIWGRRCQRRQDSPRHRRQRPSA